MKMRTKKVNSSKFNISDSSKKRSRSMVFLTTQWKVGILVASLVISTVASVSIVVATNSSRATFIQENITNVVIMSDQEIVNQIAVHNTSLQATSSNLKSKKASTIVASDLNVDSINVNLETLISEPNFKRELISFEIVPSSANDIDGTVRIRILYNNMRADNFQALLGGFAKTQQINVIRQPSNTTTSQSSNASFVYAVNFVNIDPSTAVFQWYKGDTRLTDSAGSIQGSNTSTLNLFNVQPGTAGSYRATVTAAGMTLNSSAATLTVSASAAIDVDALALRNANITVTNRDLTSRFASTIISNDLNTNNISINSTGILGFNSSLVSFVNLSNANNQNGTLQVFIRYGTTVSRFPTTLRGFRTIPNITQITIQPKTTGTTTLQGYVNGLAAGTQTTITDFTNYVNITNSITNAAVTYANAVQSVLQQRTTVSGQERVVFTFVLKPNFFTTTGSAFTFISVST